MVGLKEHSCRNLPPYCCAEVSVQLSGCRGDACVAPTGRRHGNCRVPWLRLVAMFCGGTSKTCLRGVSMAPTKTQELGTNPTVRPRPRFQARRAARPSV